MSKTAPATETPVADTTITAATRKLVDSIRQPFTGFVSGMNTLLEARAKLAPAFMRAARAYIKDTNSTFIAFVRELDADVPVAQKDYRNHSTYNAAVYLKRLVEATERDKTTTATRTGPHAVPPLASMARLIAAIKPLVPEDNLVKLWEILASELHWSEAQKNRLQALVEEAEPLFNTRAPKGGPKPVLRIAMVRHTHNGEVEAATA